MRRQKNVVLGAFGIVALWLATASVAYACTYYQGTFTATHVTSSGTTDGDYVQAWGCDLDSSISPTMTNLVTSNATTGLHTMHPTNTIRLETGDTSATGRPTSGCASTTGPPTAATLPNGDYDVFLVDNIYPSYGSSYNATPACADPGFVRANAPHSTRMGTVTVASGSITSSAGLQHVPSTTSDFTIPAYQAGDVGGMESALCIQDTASTVPGNADHGNQVPVPISVL